MRRRALLLIATMGLGGVLLLGGGGVALADTIDGTSGPDDLLGTEKSDVIHGGGGAKTTSRV
jgi:Ca2+-binding RTX toxin-like protein